MEIAFSKYFCEGICFGQKGRSRNFIKNGFIQSIISPLAMTWMMPARLFLCMHGWRATNRSSVTINVHTSAVYYRKLSNSGAHIVCSGRGQEKVICIRGFVDMNRKVIRLLLAADKFELEM